MKKEFGNLRPSSLMQIFKASMSGRGITRADIAEATGLSVMTVGKAADAMIILDILRQSSSHALQPGRPSRKLYPSARKWIGVWVIFDSSFSFYMLDLSLKIIDSFGSIQKHTVFADSALKDFAAAAALFACERRKREDCIGCGILLPCGYDENEDRIKSKNSCLSGIRLRKAFEGSTFDRCPTVGNSRVHCTNRLSDILNKESFTLVFYVDENDIKSAVIPPFSSVSETALCRADKCRLSDASTLGELSHGKRSAEKLCIGMAELAVNAVCLIGINTVVICGCMFDDMSFLRDALGNEVHMRCNALGIMPPEIISGDIKREATLDIAKNVRDKWFFEEMLNSY